MRYPLGSGVSKKCPESVSGVSRRCPRHFGDTLGTLVGHSGARGSKGRTHPVGHPRFRGHSRGHSPGHSGPGNTCSWSAGSQPVSSLHLPLTSAAPISCLSPWPSPPHRFLVFLSPANHPSPLPLAFSTFIQPSPATHPLQHSSCASITSL